MKLTVNSSIDDIFTAFTEATPKAEKVKLVLQVISKSFPQAMALKTLIRFAYDDAISHSLPDGIPDIVYPENKANLLDVPATIKHIADFVDHPARPIPTDPKQKLLLQRKQELSFVKMLNTLNEHERTILCSCKDGQLNKMYKGLTKKFFQESIPGLISK